MADQIKLRGGTTEESMNFTGAEREVTVDTTLHGLRVHDGVTPGGHLLGGSGANNDGELTLLNQGTYTAGCNVAAGNDIKFQVQLNEWLSDAVKTLDNELCDVQDDLGKVITDLATLDGRVDGHDTQLAKIEADITAINGNISDINTQLLSIEAEVETNQDNIDDLSDRVAALETSISAINTNLSEIKVDISKLQSDVSALQASVAALEVRVKANEDDISGLQTSLTAIQADITALQSTTAAINARIDALTLNDLADVDATPTNGQLLTYRDSKWVAENNPFVEAPAHIMGVIDTTTQDAPAAETGDIYIQHRADEQGGTIAGSWTGIAGEQISEGQYVMKGGDSAWHKGKTVENVTQIQSDWTETDNSSAAYIKNVPSEFPPAAHVHDYSDLINIPDIDSFPEAPADGNVYVRSGQAGDWVKGLPYDISTLPELP